MKKIPHFFIVLVCILAAVQLKAADDFLPQSKWIGSEHCQSTPNTWLCFRKTVHLPGVPGEMIANIAVDSKYWLWINGKMVVFEGGLKRGLLPERLIMIRWILPLIWRRGRIPLLCWCGISGKTDSVM